MRSKTASGLARISIASSMVLIPSSPAASSSERKNSRTCGPFRDRTQYRLRTADDPREVRAMKTKCWALAGLLLLALHQGLLAESAKPPDRGGAGKLKPCRVPGVDEEVRCGRYEVYENRAARKGRKIGLNIVVLPAKGPEIAADPLVFLAGGGVAPATRYAGFLSEAYPNLRRQRDILLVDQRGTGGANPRECDLSTGPAKAEYPDQGRFLAAG